MVIDFKWQRDETGYDLLPAGPPDPTKKDIIMAVMFSFGSEQRQRIPPPYERIARRGGKLITYRPFAEVPELSRVFAGGARTKEGLLDFVRRFGPLSSRGNSPDGEDIRYGLYIAAEMYDLLRLSPWDRAAYVSRFGDEGMPCGWPRVNLLVNAGTGRLQLKYRPGSLSDALWLALALDMSSGHETRECAFCGTWFAVGPGTGRRADAKFCLDEHRIAYNSQKRTAKG